MTISLSHGGRNPTARGAIHVGTSGWNYRHWRGIFYPQGLPVKHWLAFYSRHFNTVEINNTFYRLPETTAFAEWRRQAPPGFVYAVKASRFLTHMKKLKEPREPLENILGRTRRLGEALGPILYQLPPHWHCDVERLRQFIALLPADLVHAFEFRDASWYNDEVHSLLRETGMSFCIHDLPGLSSPMWVTGRVAYLRFHGPSAVKYAGRYDRAHLQAWSLEIRRFADSGCAVYVYFNNDGGGCAVVNARELLELLQLPSGARVS